MKTAAEVMNRTFFHASPSDSIGVLLHEMAERGLGSVPVLDSMHKPLGVAITAEIEGCYDLQEVIERLHRKAVCVDQHTPLDVAARALVRHPSSCLVLVDGGGAAVGTLSALELLAGVLGTEEPSASDHAHGRDPDWEHADILELGAAHRAPEAAGIILLSPGFDENHRRRVWAESTINMRERLDQMLREPQDEESLEALLEEYPRAVRFRCLAVEDEAQRETLADVLCNVERGSSRPPPVCIEPEVSPRGVVPTAVLASADS